MIINLNFSLPTYMSIDYGICDGFSDEGILKKLYSSLETDDEIKFTEDNVNKIIDFFNIESNCNDLAYEYLSNNNLFNENSKPFLFLEDINKSGEFIRNITIYLSFEINDEEILDYINKLKLDFFNHINSYQEKKILKRENLIKIEEFSIQKGVLSITLGTSYLLNKEDYEHLSIYKDSYRFKANKRTTGEFYITVNKSYRKELNK